MTRIFALLLIALVCLGTDCQGTAPAGLPGNPAALPADVDTDGDGLSDETERIFGTYLTNPDSDGDGLSDGDEVNVYSTDPTDKDTDSDGLSDGDEVNVYLTNPLVSDTDADGLPDGDEVNVSHTNPLLADTDADGLSDGVEWDYGLDPLCPDVLGTVTEVLCGDFIVVESPVTTGVYYRLGTPIGFPSGFLVGDTVVLECAHADYVPTGYVRVNLRSGETGFLNWLGTMTADGGLITFFLDADWLYIGLNGGRDYILFPDNAENRAVLDNWRGGHRVEIVHDVGAFYVMVNVNVCESVGVAP